MKALMVNGSPHKEGCTYTALGIVAGVEEPAPPEPRASTNFIR